MQPQPPDTPFHWPWRATEALLHRAVTEVAIEDIERRALIMSHPCFGQETATTGTMLAAFTVLDPGEQARPHRHTGAAIRFAVEAEGAATIVDGRRCEMKAGDLILTPPMAWHGHINPSSSRIIWFDAANMPLLRALNAHFFDPGNPQDRDFWKVDAGDERNWRASGLAVADQPRAPVNSPKFHYPGEITRQMLSETAAGADGARTLRYVNPATGGAVMPTLDCYAVRLGKGVETRARRGAYSTICLVVCGSGRSTIGDMTFEWSRNDVFTIPSWSWASHKATGGEADLFVVSDKVVFERLDVLREEMQ
jgi:gentisate 1,2-dioxygenase